MAGWEKSLSFLLFVGSPSNENVNGFFDMRNIALHMFVFCSRPLCVSRLGFSRLLFYFLIFHGGRQGLITA